VPRTTRRPTKRR